MSKKKEPKKLAFIHIALCDDGNVHAEISGSHKDLVNLVVQTLVSNDDCPLIRVLAASNAFIEAAGIKALREFANDNDSE